MPNGSNLARIVLARGSVSFVNFANEYPLIHTHTHTQSVCDKVGGRYQHYHLLCPRVRGGQQDWHEVSPVRVHGPHQRGNTGLSALFETIYCAL